MSEIRNEQPPGRAAKRGVSEETGAVLDGLVEAALGNRGEWMAVDAPEGLSGRNVNASLSHRVLKALGVDISCRQDVIYLRVP